MSKVFFPDLVLKYYTYTLRTIHTKLCFGKKNFGGYLFTRLNHLENLPKSDLWSEF